VAGCLVTMGTLGDRIGRRRLLLGGAAAFAVISVAAAFSTSAQMLIACRALLGIAGATLAPSTLSLIFSMFPDPKQRSTATGVDCARRVAHWLLGRWRGRPVAGRGAAGAVLVGLGVFAGRAGDGAAAGAGPASAARVPRSRRRPGRPGQRGHAPGRRAGGGLRHQADRPERDLVSRGRLHLGPAGGRRGGRAAAG